MDTVTGQEAARVCAGCGADPGEAGDYCEVCGRRLRTPAMDRLEVVADSSLAAVSDRGLRHRENQDRMGLRWGAGGVLCVVCDGVSQSHRPERAAEAVVATVLERAGVLVDEPADDRDGADVLREAVVLAVSRLGEEAPCRGDCPATTVVAALVRRGLLTVLWAGDSRAYWRADGGELQQLTADHTVEEDDGGVSHVLTRWLAADAGSDAEPEVATVALETSGTLLLCSDGLWNYAPEPAAMQALLDGVAAGGETALEVARGLVGFALERGGEDNVSVVVLRVRGEEALS